ncbi:MAG: T9SS type A sorting domain-containing protein [Ignavibacteria bacterium]|nr:T9SS type A sorting domain-containing protein [Ignavibacteria bacterium]
MEAGQHEVEFEANNLASGIYIYKIQTNEFSETKKMVLLR